jgi:hypothetical protein
MTDTIQSTSATPAGDVRARNKDILFAALAQASISKVSIEFDGAGNNGQIEDLLVWNTVGETIPLPSDRNLELHSPVPGDPPAGTADEHLSHLQSGRHRAPRRSPPRRRPGAGARSSRWHPAANGSPFSTGTTLETARRPLDLWRRLQPRPVAGYSRRRIRAAIKARLRYVRKTRTIRAAVASVKLQP